MYLEIESGTATIFNVHVAPYITTQDNNKHSLSDIFSQHGDACCLVCPEVLLYDTLAYAQRSFICFLLYT